MELLSPASASIPVVPELLPEVLGSQPHSFSPLVTITKRKRRMDGVFGLPKSVVKGQLPLHCLRYKLQL